MERIKINETSKVTTNKISKLPLQSSRISLKHTASGDRPSTASRLKYIMAKQNLRQVDVLELCKPLCEVYGVKIRKNDLSQYISGKVKPNQQRLYILAKALKVSEAWLMGFDVPMKRLSTSSDLRVRTFNKDYILKLVANYFSKYAANLIKAWEKLDNIDQGKISERIDTLLEQDKYQEKHALINNREEINRTDANYTERTGPTVDEILDLFD